MTFLSWEFPGSATHTRVPPVGSFLYLLVHRVPSGIVYMCMYVACCLRPFQHFPFNFKGYNIGGWPLPRKFNPLKMLPTKYFTLESFCVYSIAVDIHVFDTSPHPCTAQHFWCLLLVAIVEWHLSHLCRPVNLSHAEHTETSKGACPNYLWKP